jgi:transcriptional regulator with PAS, ATPase and Fis domain
MWNKYSQVAIHINDLIGIVKQLITKRSVNMCKVKIGCLTYKRLEYLTRNAIENLSDPEIEIVIIDGLMEELIEKTHDAYLEGVEVFVGGGANAKMISQETQYPVLTIQFKAMDYLEALIKAKKFGKKVGVVTYKQPLPYRLNVMENVTGLEIVPIVFTNSLQLEMDIVNTGVDTIIGASLAVETAEKLGLQSELIYTGVDTIISTIKKAKVMALALRQEREKSQVFQTILDYGLNGIVATDENGIIVLYNYYAEKTLEKKANNVLGKPLATVFPEIKMDDVIRTGMPQIQSMEVLNGVELLVNRVPIEIRGNISGSLAMFMRVSDVQKTEQKIRLLNKLKGFAAKSKFSDIVYSSKDMVEIIEKSKIYAKTNSNILVCGETGVGKEIVVQSIHNYSFRQNGPFVAVNCAALPESLLESELFGYEEGAFTGSRKGGKAGLFEMAHKGTIFLDEIGEISLNLQTRLLRVLQEKEVIRIGGDSVIPVDIRIIAATNKNLEELMPYKFREDLYYRLNVLNINLLPLRDRIVDIPLLFQHFLSLYVANTNYGNRIVRFTEDILMLYSWPGNIRELQNISERFMVLFNNTLKYDESIIRELMVSSIGKDRIFNDVLKQYGFKPNEKVKIKDISREMMEKLEIIYPGQKGRIADKLGISRTTLWRNIKQLEA